VATIFQNIASALVTGGEDVIKFFEGAASPSTKASGAAIATTLAQFETQGEAFLEGLAVDSANAALAMIPVAGGALAPLADAAIEAVAAKLFAKHTNPAAAAAAVSALVAAGATPSNAAAPIPAAPQPTSSITISPAQIQAPILGNSYSQSMSASGGSAPYAWEISSGSFPPGLSMSATGVISGVVTASGEFEVTIGARDADNMLGLATLKFVV